MLSFFKIFKPVSVVEQVDILLIRLQTLSMFSHDEGNLLAKKLFKRKYQLDLNARKSVFGGLRTS